MVFLYICLCIHSVLYSFCHRAKCYNSLYSAAAAAFSDFFAPRRLTALVPRGAAGAVFLSPPFCAAVVRYFLTLTFVLRRHAELFYTRL